MEGETLVSAAVATGGRARDRLTHLRVEEDLGPQEALVAHVDGELLLADGVDAGVLLDPLGAVRVVLVELLDQVWTHVAEALLTEDEWRRRREGGWRSKDKKLF